MKKLFKLMTVIALTVATTLPQHAQAQAPEMMSYQAVIRNASNQLVNNQLVGMQISILQYSNNGTVVYAETQTPTTNDNGLATAEIGGGNPVSGVFANIDWSNGPYFIKTETDPLGGTTYTITGVSQLLSVPYALYAETSGTGGPTGAQGPTGATGQTGPAGSANINGSSNYVIKFTGSTSGGNSQIYDAGANVAIGSTIQTFDEKFKVYNSSGMGIYAFSGSEQAVYGESNSSDAITGVTNAAGSGGNCGVFGVGNANNSNGVIGVCNNGSLAIGVWGRSSTGWAGYFSGIVYTTGSYTGSDEKLKLNIKPLSNGLELLLKLNPVTYYFDKVNYKKMNLPSGLQIGFTAQNIEQVLPELVKVTNDKATGDDFTFKSVNYIGLIPVMAEAIKEQNQLIVDLRSEMEQLKKQIKTLAK